MEPPPGHTLVRIDDGLDPNERAGLRERQADLLMELFETNEGRTEAVDTYARRNGYDLENTSDLVEATLAFEETEEGQAFERRREEFLDELADLYREFIRDRFEEPGETNKKTRIAAVLCAFGYRTDSRALARAVDASRAYLDAFSAYSELVETPDGEVGMRNNLEGPETGQPAVVLQREGRRRKSVEPRKRRAVIERDDECCRRCDASDELEVHHVEPVSHGGSDAMENLATLCSGCHGEAHRTVPGNGGIVPAYPKGRFEDWLDGAVEICAEPTADGGLCRNAAGSCPHHESS